MWPCPFFSSAKQYFLLLIEVNVLNYVDLVKSMREGKRNGGEKEERMVLMVMSMREKKGGVYLVRLVI